MRVNFPKFTVTLFSEWFNEMPVNFPKFTVTLFLERWMWNFWTYTWKFSKICPWNVKSVRYKIRQKVCHRHFWVSWKKHEHCRGKDQGPKRPQEPIDSPTKRLKYPKVWKTPNVERLKRLEEQKKKTQKTKRPKRKIRLKDRKVEKIERPKTLKDPKD